MKNLQKYRAKISNVKNMNNFLIVVIPILISIAPSIKTFFVEGWKYVFAPQNICYEIIIILLLIFFYILWYSNKNIEADRNYLDEEIITYRDTVNAYEKLNNLYNQQCAYIDRAVSMTKALDYVVKNLATLLIKDNLSPKEFKKELSNTFSLILKVYKNFYNKAGENMTIALYYYCRQTKEFWDVESAKPKILFDEINENSKKVKGRIWAENDESHICYVARRKSEHEYVFNNINEELNKPLNSKETDSINYVSSISVPIFDYENNVIGVFSITSNLPNRFDRNNKETPIISYLNRIFVDIFFDIAQVIEIIMKKYYSDINSKKALEYEILNDYIVNSSEQIKDYHKQLISNLHVVDESNC